MELRTVPRSKWEWVRFVEQYYDVGVCPYVAPTFKLFEEAKGSNNEYGGPFVSHEACRHGFLRHLPRSRRDIIPTSQRLKKYQTFMPTSMPKVREICDTVRDQMLWSIPGRNDNDQFLTWQKKAIEKLTLQCVNWLWWDIEGDSYGLVRTGDDPNPVWEQACRFFARWIRRRANPAVTHGIIRHKNHGYPTWGKDDVDLYYHAILARRLSRRVSGRTGIAEIARALSEPVHTQHESETGSLTPSLTIFSRMGPRIKPVPMTVFGVRNMAQTIGETVGLCARARLVYAAPTYINILLYETGYAWAVGVLKALGIWHDKSWTVNEHIKKINDMGFGVALADDMAAYDHHISFSKMLQFSRALDDELGEEHPLSLFTRISTAVETMPLLVAGPTSTSSVRQLHRTGMLTSGQRGTTYWGCVVNILRQLCIQHIEGRSMYIPTSLPDLPSDAKYVSIIWGDDTILFYRDQRMIPAGDDWADKNARLGLEVTFDDGPIFLQKWEGLYANTGRMLQQTLGPEKVPSGPFGFMNSLCERMKLLSEHPKREDIYQLIKENCEIPLPSSSDELIRRCQTEEFMVGFSGELHLKGGLSSIEEISYLLDIDSPKLYSIAQALGLSMGELEDQATISPSKLREESSDERRITEEIHNRYGRGRPR